MPEGPEIKVMSKNITNILKDKILYSICPTDSSQGKSFFNKRFKGYETLSKILPNKVVSVNCHGKFSYIELENGCYVVYGCGLNGNFRLNPTPEILKNRSETKEKYMKNTVVKIVIRNSERGSNSGSDKILYYHDTMRIGYWEVYPSKKELTTKLKKLGPDIMSELPLDNSEILKCFRRFRSNICKVLLNQKCFAGIGNYMKSEILYHTKTDPHLNIVDISDDKLIEMYNFSRELAKKAFKHTLKNSSFYSFSGLSGDQSPFKKTLTVYGKSVCPRGYQVLKIVTPDKRGTYWVPELQSTQSVSEITKKPKKEKIKITIIKKKTSNI